MIIDLSKNNKDINIPMTNIINNYGSKESTAINNSVNNHLNQSSIRCANKLINQNNVLDSCINKPTMCINYKESNCTSIISVNGPSEARLKFKTKVDSSYIDILITYSTEIDKLKQVLINNYVKNFCENVIKCDDYPRCLITVSITVLTCYSETELKKHLINGTMLCLVLSGISLYGISLGVVIDNINNNKDNCLVVMNVNNLDEIYSIESENTLSCDKYNYIVEEAAKQINNEYYNFKKMVINLTSF